MATLPPNTVLRPCPFCGGPAVFGEANWTGVPKIECGNYGKWIDGVWHRELSCLIQPTTYNGKLERYKGLSEEQIVDLIVKWWNGEHTPAAQDARVMAPVLADVDKLLEQT